MIQLDAVDKAILLVLQRDTRLSYAQIGAQVGLSAAAVHDRVKKLEKRGVILGYKVQVDPEVLGLGLTAFIAVRLENHASANQVAPRLAEFSEIEEFHSVAGEVDLLLKVRSASPKALEELIYRLKAVEGVARTTSSVVLTTMFEGRPLIPVRES